MLKNKFIFLFTMCMLVVACATQQPNMVYSISRMVKISKDTLSSTELKHMVSTKQIPPLKKFAKAYLTNVEEGQTNAYYTYYDSISNNLYNIKEIVSQKDTNYIIEKKLFNK